MSPVRRETAEPVKRGGRTIRLTTYVTPAERERLRRAAELAGYRSFSEWNAAVLLRQVQLLSWHAANEDTPDELGSEEPTEHDVVPEFDPVVDEPEPSRAPSTTPPPLPEDP